MQLKVYLDSGLSLLTLNKQVYVGEVVNIQLPNANPILVKVDRLEGLMAVGYRTSLKTAKATNVCPFPDEKEDDI